MSNTMSDARWARITGTKVNRAAERRQHAAERAAVIAALGMAPEGATPDERYPSTTGEMRGWLASGWRAAAK